MSSFSLICAFKQSSVISLISSYSSVCSYYSSSLPYLRLSEYIFSFFRLLFTSVIYASLLFIICYKLSIWLLASLSSFSSFWISNSKSPYSLIAYEFDKLKLHFIGELFGVLLIDFFNASALSLILASKRYFESTKLLI